MKYRTFNSEGIQTARKKKKPAEVHSKCPPLHVSKEIVSKLPKRAE